VSGHEATGHETTGHETTGHDVGGARTSRARGRGSGAVAALGDLEEVAGFGLAGARLVGARSQAEAVVGWEGLDDAVLVVVTATVAGWLGSRLTAADAPLTVVVPA
jgi:hypothetical protein